MSPNDQWIDDLVALIAILCICAAYYFAGA
jgi:hypothetical protein